MLWGNLPLVASLTRSHTASPAGRAWEPATTSAEPGSGASAGLPDPFLCVSEVMGRRKQGSGGRIPLPTKS